MRTAALGFCVAIAVYPCYRRGVITLKKDEIPVMVGPVANYDYHCLRCHDHFHKILMISPIFREGIAMRISWVSTLNRSTSCTVRYVVNLLADKMGDSKLCR